MEIETTVELVSKVYKKSSENVEKFRKVVNRPLTLTEKILAGHLEEISEKNNKYFSELDFENFKLEVKFIRKI